VNPFCLFKKSLGVKWLGSFAWGLITKLLVTYSKIDSTSYHFGATREQTNSNAKPLGPIVLTTNKMFSS